MKMTGVKFTDKLPSQKPRNQVKPDSLFNIYNTLTIVQIYKKH